jgi:5-methyltetrahydrofolate corrinoid/iron sulfur protein methyltransferase
MLVIGEKINVMNKTLGQAMLDRDEAPILAMAAKQLEAGADLLDINLGPATKQGPERMVFVVETIQREYPDARLCLDTMNVEAMAAGLAVCRNRPMINSISAERAKIDALMPLAKQHEADVIGLAMTESGISRDCNERVMAAAEIIGACFEFDVPVDRLYLDPLLLPVCVAQDQALEAVEAVRMFKQLNDPAPMTTVGLSNIFNGCPEPVKPALAATLLALLREAGLDSAIMDPNDEAQMRVARAEDPSAIPFDAEMEAALPIMRNEALYCHSFLD